GVPVIPKRTGPRHSEQKTRRPVGQSDADQQEVTVPQTLDELDRTVRAGHDLVQQLERLAFGDCELRRRGPPAEQLEYHASVLFDERRIEVSEIRRGGEGCDRRLPAPRLEQRSFEQG